jgi:hypothetical protein
MAMRHPTNYSTLACSGLTGVAWHADVRAGADRNEIEEMIYPGSDDRGDDEALIGNRLAAARLPPS